MRAPSSQASLGRGSRTLVAAAASVFLLQACRAWLLPVVLAAIVTLLLCPLTRRLARAGVPPAVGAGLVLMALGGVAVFGIAWAAVPAESLGARVSAAQVRLLALQRSASRAVGAEDDGIARTLQSAEEAWLRALPARVAGGAVTSAATLMLAYFMLAAEESLVRRCALACPTPRRRARLLGTLRQTRREVTAFVATMVATCLLLGAATGAALAAIGFADAAWWGLFAGVVTIVPYVGPAVVAAALLVAGAAAYGADVRLLLPCGLFLLLHFLEGNFLTPFLMGARLRLRPVFILVAVLALGSLWGFAGGFVAVPVLLAVRAAGLRSRASRAARLLSPDRR
jgi:predicted PurR-regulated permease PerM